MIDNKIKFYLEKAPWDRGINIHIGHLTEQGWATSHPINFEYKELGISSLPALSIDFAESQQLIDALWHCGLRPSEGSGSAGALAATQRHLDDMRKLVFELTIKKGGRNENKSKSSFVGS